MRKPMMLLLALLILTVQLPGQGTTLWNEASDGLLSEDPFAPTSLMPMQAGINSVIGAAEIVPTPPNWAGHPNFFTIQVPNGFVVQSIFLQIDKPDVWAWIGDVSFNSHLAYTLNSSNGDLLTQLDLHPLTGGVYGMYLANHDLQESVSIANFHLDFVVVPEPSTMALGLAAAAGLFGLHVWRGLHPSQDRKSSESDTAF